MRKNSRVLLVVLCMVLAFTSAAPMVLPTRSEAISLVGNGGAEQSGGSKKAKRTTITPSINDLIKMSKKSEKGSSKTKNLSKREKKKLAVVEYAKSFKGKIKYLWGGKPSHKYSGDDAPKALDCSGFMMFIFWNTLGKKDSRFYSTYSITSSFKRINRSELEIGDLGTIYSEGSSYVVKYLNDECKKCKKKFYDDYAAEAFCKKRKAKLKKKIKKLEKRNAKLLDYIDDNKEVEEVSAEFGEDIEAYNEACKEKEEIEANKELYKREIKLNKAEIKGLKKLRKSCKMVDKINHVGVYCGKTSGGKEIWCHCASSMHGVVVMKGYKKFKCFYRSL